MCGIAGIIDFHSGLKNSESLLTMSRVIRHRGPDDVGFILGNSESGDYTLVGGKDTPDEVYAVESPYRPKLRVEHLEDTANITTYNLALLNRRLAIVDLSPNGHQPMCNEDGSLWIVYNGEIYNFPELRSELKVKGHQFRSHSDTEMILHAYEEWGGNCANRFNGMWAFVIWDRKRRQLFISRDRTGIKPLYYFYDQQRLYFASELKVLLELGVSRKANQLAIFDFLAGNLSDHTTITFFKEIQSLAPAHNLTLDLTTRRHTIQQYWQIDPTNCLDLKSDQAYVEQFSALFEDAVRLHLLSDRPVGTCLSGGLDSSSLVGMIARLIGERGLHVVGMEGKQKTFSSRFRNFAQDEGRFIEVATNEFSVDSYMTYPSIQDFRNEWKQLFWHQEEPFASTSIFAQWSVFKLAHQNGVTVTLDGQGGDELLAGYMGGFPYLFADQFSHLRFVNMWHELSTHSHLHGANTCWEIRNIFSNLLPAKYKLALKVKSAGKQSWLAKEFAQSMTNADTYTRWNGLTDAPTRFLSHALSTLSFDPLPSLLRFDDRNSMAHSVESRVPFLDYRLIEFCFALPIEQKIRNGETKYIFRQAMRNILPELIRNRHDKIGFSTPQDVWIRQLGEWMRTVFSESHFLPQKYVNLPEVLKLLDLHISGKQNFSPMLWRILAVELWHRAMDAED